MRIEKVFGPAGGGVGGVRVLDVYPHVCGEELGEEEEGEAGCEGGSADWGFGR